MNTTNIPYSPEHRKELAKFCGLEDIDTYSGSKNCLRVLGREILYGITYECFLLPDGRVLVTREDRYVPMTKASLYPDRATWSQWWYTDRFKWERDPETGRYRT